MGSSQCYHSQNMQAPYLRKGSPMENYVSLWTSEKSTFWLQMFILKIFTQLAPCQTQHNTWKGNPYSASSTAPKLISLQMADQRSVEMLAFIFARRTFAYKRLAQGLSRSVSAFSSFMREYLDLVVKADHCAQCVDDIGIAANNATDLTRNIRAVFKSIRQAGLKLTIEKRQFRVRQVEFLRWTFSPEGISP